jgi:GT2 family glycosyltransferase
VTTHAGFATTSTGFSHKPEVAVVICAYTQARWPELVRSVDSVRAQQTPARQLILVIDHDPELLDRARTAFPGLLVTPNTGPRGLSGARNTGLARARCEIVAFLDDDAVAAPNWLTRLVRHYEDPAVLAVGGRARPAWAGTRPRWLPPEFDWVVGCSFTGQPDGVAPVRNLIGCNMSFRRDALLRTGGFDPALGRVGKVPAGCEETELCIRLRRRHPGGVILYDPGAEVSHRVTGERATWRYFRRRCYSEGRSKAVVARLAGTASGLSAEREYAGRTLPRGLRRELRASRTGDPDGLLRAAAILAGLAVTGGGYLLARARGARDCGAGAAAAAARTRGARDSGAGAALPGRAERPGPVRVLAVDVAAAVPAVPDAGGPGGRRYRSAQVLVRRDRQPLGVMHVDLPPGGLSAGAHAALVHHWLAGNDLAAAAPDPGGEDRQAAPAAPRPTPFASVVVPTCGRPGALRRCLSALAGLEYPDYEVVVVDNAPARSGVARLVAVHAAGDPRVRYAAEPRRGVAYARNRGLAEARGEIVAFADDDVVADAGWLRALVDGFADEQVAAVTGYVLPAELETPAQIWVEQYGGFGKGCHPRRYEAGGYWTVENGQAQWVPAASGSLYPYLPGTYGSGANMAFRAATLRRLGGFDPRFGSGAAIRAGEDIDVLMRVVLAGHALVYQPEAIVWHRHHRELPALRRTVYQYGVGLTAVLTKCLVSDRAGRRQLASRIPRGIGYALRPGSAKNAGKRPGYPASLTALEICGMALGPAYFARAAWAGRAARGRR